MKRVSETEAKNRLDAILDEAQREPIVTVERNAFRVLRLDPRSPRVTAAQVARLLDELP